MKYKVYHTLYSYNNFKVQIILIDHTYFIDINNTEVIGEGERITYVIPTSKIRHLLDYNDDKILLDYVISLG